MTGKLIEHDGRPFAILICDHKENMKIVETIEGYDMTVFQSPMELVK